MSRAVVAALSGLFAIWKLMESVVLLAKITDSGGVSHNETSVGSQIEVVPASP